VQALPERGGEAAQDRLARRGRVGAGDPRNSSSACSSTQTTPSPRGSDASPRHDGLQILPRTTTRQPPAETSEPRFCDRWSASDTTTARCNELVSRMLPESLCEPCFASECDSGRRIIGASEKTAPRPATAWQRDSSQPRPESRSGRSASMDPEFRRRSLRGVSRGANGSSVTPARRRSGSGSTAQRHTSASSAGTARSAMAVATADRGDPNAAALHSARSGPVGSRRRDGRGRANAGAGPRFSLRPRRPMPVRKANLQRKAGWMRRAQRLR
jgi:hypothetical protein